MSLRNLRIASRLFILMGVALTAIAGITAYQLSQLHDQMMVERRAQTESVVQAARGVLEHFAAAEAAGHTRREQAQKSAAEVIRGMRYGNGDYLTIADFGNVAVMHPVKPDLARISHTVAVTGLAEGHEARE